MSDADDAWKASRQAELVAPVRKKLDTFLAASGVDVEATRIDIGLETALASVFERGYLVGLEVGLAKAVEAEQRADDGNP